MKDCSNGPGHMTNMAAMPYMVKTIKLFSGTKRPMTLNEVGMQHRVLEYFQVCSNDDTVSTLTYFKAMSNLVYHAFVWVEGKTMDFSETVIVCDIKVSRCSQLDECMILYEYQRSRAFIDIRPRSLRFNIFEFRFPRNH